MKAKRRLRTITVGILLAGVLGLVIWRAARPREPVYEGRTLSRWLDHHVASTAARPPYGTPGWKEADKALRTIGTNAIPTLLQMLRAKDHQLAVIRTMQFAERCRWTRWT